MATQIFYQGEAGAFSHLACSTYYPQLEPVPCASFAAAFAAVKASPGALAMIPVENNVAGRVSDIYHLLPSGALKIIGERYLAVHHQLLGLPGTALSDVKSVRSHPMALGQVRRRLAALNIEPVSDTDTAAAARRVVQNADPSVGAIASSLAAEIYGLEILAENIEDEDHNTTRFLVLAPQAQPWPALHEPTISSYVFQLRSVPSALYKALGGFATNGLNITKLESYIKGGAFKVAQFYIDVEAHPESAAMQHALEELEFFTDMIIHLGTYPADPLRALGHEAGE